MMGSPNILVMLFLWGWPALAVALFAFLPPRRALVSMVIAAPRFGGRHQGALLLGSMSGWGEWRGSPERCGRRRVPVPIGSL